MMKVEGCRVTFATENQTNDFFITNDPILSPNLIVKMKEYLREF